jgi:hypothetical protein
VAVFSTEELGKFWERLAALEGRSASASLRRGRNEVVGARGTIHVTFSGAVEVGGARFWVPDDSFYRAEWVEDEHGESILIELGRPRPSPGFGEPLGIRLGCGMRVGEQVAGVDLVALAHVVEDEGLWR